MNEKLYDALEALCMMWEQYCGDECGHYCMSAGERTDEVLDRYNLLINRKGSYIVTGKQIGRAHV